MSGLLSVEVLRLRDGRGGGLSVEVFWRNGCRERPAEAQLHLTVTVGAGGRAAVKSVPLFTHVKPENPRGHKVSTT